jgi:lantibiotic biosynthesis protein
MSYTFSPYLLLRTPAGDASRYAENIQQFLNDPNFCSGLMLATPALFAIVQKRHFDATNLNEKEAAALKKYINRFCFRPTPFGLFASVSLITWSENFLPTNDKPTFTWHCRPDMAYNHLLANSLTGNLENPTYEINPSIYRVLNEYRFIRTWIGNDGRSREYQLQSIAYSPLIRDLVSLCRTGRNRQDIIEKISMLAACDLAESMDYADFLIDAQILISCRRMAISGKDQFQALTDSLPGGELKDKIKKLVGKLCKLPPADPKNQIAVLSGIQQELSELLPEQSPGEKPKLNVILKRVSSDDHINTSYQRHIRDGITALSLLSGEDEVSAMSNFVSSYLKHFEGQSLPLLVALDPEAGIGYQQPLKVKNNPLLETLNIPQKRGTPAHGHWSQRHSLLMEAWLRDRSAQPVIRLAETDLQKLKGYGEPKQTLGMSVLFRSVGEKVYIENAGGINAPALLGRFTVADEAIKKAAADMARSLEIQNPDVIFAELLQLADPHTDNVNTREHIYQYEIPVTAVSTLPENRQIPLSDLYLSIVENRVMLFSIKHQKIVVPRLTSAYNHSLNKLPLFRFLADLPYQYGQYSLAFDLRQFFPGQSFYPRVEYKDTVLSPATWIINCERLILLQKADPENISAAYQELSEQLQLPLRFSLAEGDQELVFDSTQSSDIWFFRDCVKEKNEVILKEYFEQNAIRQYNCYLLPEEPLSLPRPIGMGTLKVKTRRKYVPGSEWLYLKIYAPKIGADRLLLHIRPLLNKIYAHGRISEWFFIRYEDHAPHIRLRLKVAPEDTSEILLAFKIKLEGRIHQHLIREYQIDTYSRELERYAFAGIEKTERFFWASSELLMSFLQQNRKRTIVGTYAFALCSAQAMIAEFLDDPADQIGFTLESYQQFATEFSDKSLKVDLDKKYRELTTGITTALASTPTDLFNGSDHAAKRFLKCLKDTHCQADPMKNKAGYLRSLIHMHLNRIFADEGRKQEMIIYYLLHKFLRSAQGRSRRSLTGQPVTGS